MRKLILYELQQLVQSINFKAQFKKFLVVTLLNSDETIWNKFSEPSESETLSCIMY